MANVTAHKLGPGTLKFGATGSEQEFASHVTTCTISPSFNEEDPIPTLSGDQFVDGDAVFEGTISGEFLQEYTVTGLVKWTWDHNGETVPFVFTPRNDAELSWTGECVVRPVNVGGEVKTANTAEFEWRVLELPNVETLTGV